MRLRVIENGGGKRTNIDGNEGWMTRLILRLMGWVVWDLDAEAYFVGVWTGPDEDLIAVRPCKTYAAANYWLSCSANTLAGAVFRSLVLRFTGLRIVSWTMPKDAEFDSVRGYPIRHRRWTFTTHGSGSPRHNTWWSPKRVKSWVVRDELRRRRFAVAVKELYAILAKHYVEDDNGVGHYASGWSDGRVAKIVGLDPDVVEDIRTEN